MRYIFKFPDIGEGLDEGTINQWFVKKGQSVSVGDPLVNMETDKVAADIPSPRNGIIVQIFGKPGDVVKVGEPLVEIELEGSSESSATEETTIEAVNEEGAGVVGTLEVAGNNAYLPASDEIVLTKKSDQSGFAKKAIATPVARAYAKELNIDINEVKGSGPNNRVLKQDILDFSNKVYTKSVAPEKEIRQEIPQSSLFDYEPLSQIRKTIAKNMVESKHNAAHMTVFEEVEVSELIKLRDQFKKGFESKGIKLTYLAFIIKAVALSLKKFRSLNAQMDLQNNRMIYKNFYNIGIAVDTDYGLVVPVVKNADKLSIADIAVQISLIAEKARKRELKIEDMSDGTFTITNFGAIGGLFAVPVINYPQAAILGIGRLVQKPVVKDNNIVVGNIFPLSMSVDHRIVDGGDAARFINSVITYLNSPASMLLD